MVHGFGYIINPKNIVVADSQDTYTINNSLDEDELFIIKKPVKLPFDVEDGMIQDTINKNGEMLNYDNERTYSEVVVDDYEISGVYVISYGEKEFSPHFNEGKKLAEEKGIVFKERDIAKEREKLGLAPLTEEMKKRLCRNVTVAYCEKNRDRLLNVEYYDKQRKFADSHYEDFSKRFISLKRENPEYTVQDIENIFRTMMLDDIVNLKAPIYYNDDIYYYDNDFIGEISDEEKDYIMNKRYDLSRYDTIEEFSEKLSEIKNIILNGTYCDEMLNIDKENINYTLTEEELLEMFNSDKKDFKSIVNAIANHKIELKVEDAKEQNAEEKYEEIIYNVDESKNILEDVEQSKYEIILEESKEDVVQNFERSVTNTVERVENLQQNTKKNGIKNKIVEFLNKFSVFKRVFKSKEDDTKLLKESKVSEVKEKRILNLKDYINSSEDVLGQDVKRQLNENEYVKENSTSEKEEYEK